MSRAARRAFEHLESLERLLGRRSVGLITDVDGTISAIADAPDEARVTPSMRSLLCALAARLRLVAAVSGRSAADVRRLVGVSGMVYVGNHGLERWTGGRVDVHPAARPYLPAIKATLAELGRRLRLAGLVYEDKGVTASVHYRLAPDRELARRAILAALDSVESARALRVTEGRLVVELRPPVPVDKGVAVAALLRDYSLEAALYLGDDRTDVDAFRALRSLSRQSTGFAGLAVAVLSPEGPADLALEADLVVDGVAEVERLLRYVLDRA